VGKRGKQGKQGNDGDNGDDGNDGDDGDDDDDGFDDSSFMQPLRTAVSGGGTAVNVQTPHGTIQITRVAFNAKYAEWAIDTLTEFWQTRYLPALWQKQNGMLAPGEVPRQDEAYTGVKALLKRRLEKRRRAELESQVLTLDVEGGNTAAGGRGGAAGGQGARGARGRNNTQPKGGAAGPFAFRNEYVAIEDVRAVRGPDVTTPSDAAQELADTAQEAAEAFGFEFDLW